MWVMVPSECPEACTGIGWETNLIFGNICSKKGDEEDGRNMKVKTTKGHSRTRDLGDE